MSKQQQELINKLQQAESNEGTIVLTLEDGTTFEITLK